jgi:hypothetical protein
VSTDRQTDRQTDRISFRQPLSAMDCSLQEECFPDATASGSSSGLVYMPKAKAKAPAKKVAAKGVPKRSAAAKAAATGAARAAAASKRAAAKASAATQPTSKGRGKGRGGASSRGRGTASIDSKAEKGDQMEDAEVAEEVIPAAAPMLVRSHVVPKRKDIISPLKAEALSDEATPQQPYTIAIIIIMSIPDNDNLGYAVDN